MKIKSALLCASTLLAAVSLQAEPSILLKSNTEDVRTGHDFFVRWQQGTAPQVMNDFYSAAGVRVVWQSDFVPGLVRVEPLHRSLDNTARAMTELAANPFVMYAQPNYRVRRTLVPVEMPSEEDDNLVSRFAPNDPSFSKQWGLNGTYGINVEKAWTITKGTKSNKVAVIDTGVQLDHPDLKGQTGKGYDNIDKTSTIKDGHGHGTHCAGVIGAATNNGVGIAGINQEVTIIPLRAVPNDGDESDADVIASFEFASKAGARVASCSFGKKQSAQAVGDTIAAVGKKGLLAVVAAGNDSNDINKKPEYPACFKADNILVVASITSKGEMSSFSNYGMGKVHIAAPGSDILSTYKDSKYSKLSGTSMATPHVAGVAGLIFALNPNFTPVQVKEIINKSGRKLQGLSGKIITGATLDAGAALAAAAQSNPSPAPNPPTPDDPTPDDPTPNPDPTPDPEPPPAPKPPSSKVAITSHPSSQTASLGADVTFTVAASGGKKPYNYAWYWNNSKTEETSATFTFEVREEDRDAQIHVVVRDAQGATAQSRKATLTVR